MLDVALSEHGYVAVGSDGGTDAAIWQSPDGVTWTRIDTAAQSFDGILFALDPWIDAGERHGRPAGFRLRARWCGDGVDIPRRRDVGSGPQHHRGIRIRRRGRRRRHRGLRRDAL